jgi:serine/threonine protein kinase
VSRALFLLPPDALSGADSESPRRLLRRLPAEGVLRLGSGADCEVQLTGNDIAPVHGRLTCSPEAVTFDVEDGATEVALGDLRVRQATMEDGAALTIGEARVLLGRCDGGALEGSLLGGYLIEKHLGDGSMGSVYRARQLSLHRTVALKILLAEFTRDREFVKGFLREARAVAQLDHTNVVQIFDALQHGDTFFFSMELVGGGSLSGLLSQQGIFPIDQALGVALDVLRALAWAETRGIVHRDIKPDNILLTEEGVAKICDLGIALVPGSESDMPQATIRRGGSARYMSPEQALGRDVDHRSDVYSVGCTLYRTLAGRAPFEGQTVREILQAKLQGQAAPLEFLAPRTPRPVAQVVGRMLARDPAERYPSCAAALEALEGAASNAKGSSRMSKRRRRKILRRYSHAAGRSSRQPLLMIFLAVAVVITLWLLRKVLLNG